MARRPAPLNAASLGPGDPEGRNPLSARLRLAQGRQARRAAFQQAAEGLLAGGERQGSGSVGGENGLTIQVPAEAPDKIASVIALELDGKPQPFAYRVRPAADGTLSLNAADAEIEGSAKLEERGGMPNIGFWLDPKTTVHLERRRARGRI